MDTDNDAAEDALHDAEHAWNESLHPRGFHGRWVYSGGRRADWDAQEQRVFDKLNPEGHRILHGFGSTMRLHGGPNAFSAARADLHRGIIYDETAGHAADRDHPEALMTSGGPASGKSWITANRAPSDPVIVDSDRVMTGEGARHGGLPEYHRLVASRNHEVAASAAHEEASLVSKMLANTAIDQKQNLVLDGVGDSPRGTFADKVRNMLAARYDVRVEHMHADKDQAAKMEAERAEKTNRKIDPVYFNEAHDKSAANMRDVAKVPGAKITIWSANGFRGGGQPIKVASGVGSTRGLAGLTVHNQAEWEKFMRKAQAGSKRG